MKTKIGLLALAAMLFQGCFIHSLYPLYTNDILIENPNLEGNWISIDTDSINQNCPEGFSFEKHKGQNHYHMKMCSENQWIEMTVHLVKIGVYHYIDFYPESEITPEEQKKSSPTFWDMHHFPVHSFARIHIAEDELSLEYFNIEWLENLFEQRKIRIKHEKVNGNILLTAPSVDLQKFVEKYAYEKEAFEYPVVYKKQL